MGFLGTSLSYRFLKSRYPGGAGVPMPQGDPFKEKGTSKLATYFGPAIFDELRDKEVLDFGCGHGDNAIELAERGCRHVIGLDINEDYLRIARTTAQQRGVTDRVEFVTEAPGKVDVVLTTDAMEHFSDPLQMLRLMRDLLKPGGYILVEFGPTWLHPHGGHLFSVFPWAHLVFTEKAMMRWRSDFKHDQVKCYADVLNFMTIRRWERLVPAAGLRFEFQELVPIRPARRLHNRLTREFFTSIVRARLVPA